MWHGANGRDAMCCLCVHMVLVLWCILIWLRFVILVHLLLVLYTSLRLLVGLHGWYRMLALPSWFCCSNAQNQQLPKCNL